MIDRGLALLLAGCALFAGVILFELTSGDADSSARAPIARRPETGPAPRAQGPRVEELLATILDRPLFSPTRQPVAGNSSDQADFNLADARLTGIVVEPERRLAIFAVVGAKPIVRSEGETMNDWRVESIAPGEVVLSGPAGKMTLHPKIDASLVRPAAALPRPGQVQPAPAARPGAAPAGLIVPGQPRAPGSAVPNLPGAALPKLASPPAVAPLGAPVPPVRLPGAAGGKE